jgi:pyrroloquinoline quinone biosynthesis protein D
MTESREPSGSATSAAGSTLVDSTRLAVGRGFRLQWEPVQNAHVLLYPEGMIKLNGSAGAIMSRCDGERTVAAIIADLERAFGATDLAKDVTAFVAFAVDKKWLEIRA